MQHVLFAYIDPGTGSLIFQMGAAALVTFAVWFHKFRHMVFATVRGWLGKSPPEDVPPSDEAAGAS
jgi:hypothetical protein